MGVYDMYGPRYIQLKVGPCELKHYKIGARAPMKNGVYLGWDGCVVVLKGKIAATFPYIVTTWGKPVDLDAVLGAQSGVARAIKKWAKTLTKKKKRKRTKAK